MAMQTKSQLFNFDKPGTQQGSWDFTNTVRSAAVPIMSYDVSFGSSDHHLKDLEVGVTNVETQDSMVTFEVTFNLKDGSSNKGSGDVNIVIIADVESS